MSTPTLPRLPSLQMPAVSPGFRISKDQLTMLVPAVAAAALGGYLLSRYGLGCGYKKGRVNANISKDKPKVVDSFDMEDIGSKAVYCRCWRSKKFPYCDGAHTKHNDQTGDNVGPLIIKKRNA